MSEQPNYYAIIPANVRYDKRLKANEKLLYGEITALSSSTGYCYATNKYFAELYGVTSTSISLWVKSLIDFGYIKSHINYKRGTKEILNRYLSLVALPIQEILNTPPQENLKDNNTSINNTSINNIENGETPSLFSNSDIEEKKKKKEKATMFRNSEGLTLEYAKSKLKEQLDAGVNIEYYYHAVSDWSEKKPSVKRTVRGWIATIRDFMRSDNEKNKLKVTMPDLENNMENEALKYLNM